MANRLYSNNIGEYLKDNYNEKSPIKTDAHLTTPFPLLLQKDYGEEGDCTLTCITACLRNKLPNVYITKIYSKVEEIAKKYFYNGKTYGTIPIFIKSIYTEAAKYFGLNLNIRSKYIKNIGYKFTDIERSIQQRMPVILNLKNDGRDYYKDHSVTVIGYEIYNNKYKFLLVYDNWYRGVSYIDYDKLCAISSINY